MADDDFDLYGEDLGGTYGSFGADGEDIYGDFSKSTKIYNESLTGNADSLDPAASSPKATGVDDDARPKPATEDAGASGEGRLEDDPKQPHPSSASTSPEALTVPEKHTGAAAHPPRSQPAHLGNGSRSLFVQDLTWYTTDEDLRQVCVDAGVGDQVLPLEITFQELRVNGKSKGIAYLEFTNPESAAVAKEFFDKIVV
ncbi:uncharacterized protein BJ171DRAFT_585400 [Polychytrium aggregatum]|uniref:uncharacterized protein n=1 Tax=Polychytrium aggregatum TaxID=110093 RepID=UPI0022FE42E1|nr:uncharacterized protein BJ171DRAFT_585400 [Polychytrium aggregatum]KAI9199373.1 hypothetical protein BJ171DRAFT_585400 [Polychytrium aggregatum]